MRKPSTKTCRHCTQTYIGLSQSRFCGDACRLKYYVTPNESGCWLWPSNRSNGQYGIAKAGPTQPTVMAHRLSYETFVGPIPPGKVVMHACDVTLCVNPAHLHLGTNADNTADMCSKRRHCHGETSPKAVLSETQARAIYADARAWSRIAKDYGVSKSAVMMIKTRRNWQHIHGAL